MREFDALRGYPAAKRSANRTIINKITACYRGREFFDGARENGYGGLKNDGRWRQIAQRMCSDYGLSKGSAVLQINCEKGFLLSEFERLGIVAYGTESSAYAIDHAAVHVDAALPEFLPYPDQSFDLVLAIGPVYTLPLIESIRCLREIERVKRGASFITLGAYETENDFWLMNRWSLLGCLILKKEEWLEVLNHAGYTGDYRFNTPRNLGLE